MKIDQLCNPSNTGYPLNKRYPKPLIAKYEKDLRRVVELAAEGNCLPTRKDLKNHFEEEYGIIVGEGAIHRHITLIQKGQSLWRK